jgi:hypothetical protein
MATTSYGCNEDKDDDWSTQATQGSDSEEENNDLEKKSKKEPPCIYHPSLEGFKEFLELDNRALLRKYVVENPNDFCTKCGINVKFTDLLFAAYEYEAVVLSKPNCDICGGKRICDAFQHLDYHEENCLKL